MNTSGNQFTVGDALILLGATAIGLGIVSPFSAEIARDLSGTSRQQAVRIAVGSAWPCIVAWTLGVLALFLRRDRDICRLAGQPGGAACIAPITVLMLGLLQVLGFALARGFQVPETPNSVLFGLCSEPGLATYSGLAVAGLWLLMHLKKQWRPACSWVERAGRLLGFVWTGRLAVLVILLAVDIVEYLRLPQPSF
jgi:hypothetical protein